MSADTTSAGAVTSQDEKTTLLGDTKQDYASILRWMSFANSEILPSLGGWFNPLIGRRPFNKQEVDESMNATLQRMQIMEDHLSVNTYLVGEHLTLADLFVVGVVAGGFMFFFDKAWRAEHPAVTRWFEHVYAQPIYADVAGKPVLVEKAMPNAPPKKEGMPTQKTQVKDEPKLAPQAQPPVPV
jgi:elongation factor 1-gamma